MATRMNGLAWFSLDPAVLGVSANVGAHPFHHIFICFLSFQRGVYYV